MAKTTADEVRHGVELTSLDTPLFDGADATKRDLVDYLDAVADRFVCHLQDRPLSVIRAHRGQRAFMQKNLPSYAPDFVQRVDIWAEASKRTVSHALCNDRRTLLWFANQRAVEYHPALVRVADVERITHLVLDLDPPEGDDSFRRAAEAAMLVKEALEAAGLAGAVKTSGAKGVHVFVPLDASVSTADVAAAARALAERAAAVDPTIATTAFVKHERGGKVFVDSTRVGGATVIAAYSPRIRPGVPVSFPVSWGDLASVEPRDFTIRTAIDLLGDDDRWAAAMPDPQPLPADLVGEGTTMPTPRVEAMHEGKRRKRAGKVQERDRP